MKNHEKSRQGQVKHFGSNFQGFWRLLVAFGHTFARLLPAFFEAGFRRGKKRGFCPPLARLWHARWRRIPNPDAGRKKRPAGLRSLSARNGPGRTLSLSLTRPGPCTQGHAGFSPQSGILRRAPLRGFCPQKGFKTSPNHRITNKNHMDNISEKHTKNTLRI